MRPGFAAGFQLPSCLAASPPPYHFSHRLHTFSRRGAHVLHSAGHVGSHSNDYALRLILLHVPQRGCEWDDGSGFYPTFWHRFSRAPRGVGGTLRRVTIGPYVVVRSTTGAPTQTCLAACVTRYDRAHHMIVILRSVLPVVASPSRVIKPAKRRPISPVRLNQIGTRLHT